MPTRTGNPRETDPTAARLIPTMRRRTQSLPGNTRTTVHRPAGPDGVHDARTLTAREQDIMNLLVRGYAVNEIAKKLGVTVKTVRNNLSRIFAKLGVHRQPEAILIWLGFSAGR